MPILLQQPQTHLELTKLINIMKTKRFEIFMKNIKTRWISILSLAKMVMVEYWTHFMKMSIGHGRQFPNCNTFEHLTNLDVLLFLACIIPFLEMVHSFIIFSRER